MSMAEQQETQAFDKVWKNADGQMRATWVAVIVLALVVGGAAAGNAPSDTAFVAFGVSFAGVLLITLPITLRAHGRLRELEWRRARDLRRDYSLR